MADIGHLVSAKQINPILPTRYPPNPSSLTFQGFQVSASSNPKKHSNISLISKRNPKNSRGVVRISTSHGKWPGTWTCDFLVSLRDLNLEDLAEDDEHQPKNSDVSIYLSIDKHASFGFSVEGRIITAFTRKCSICLSPYCKEIDTSFTVWLLPTGREKSAGGLPEIGGDDPSVIYVKPGSEADLDSLIQDTIRLTASVKDTCSELCENSEPKLQYIGKQNTASISKMWSGLLKLRKE